MVNVPLTMRAKQGRDSLNWAGQEGFQSLYKDIFISTNKQIDMLDSGFDGVERINTLLGALRAIAEPTRLRLLALLAEGELTVGEIARILGQSQPRVSRHLKMLSDSGLLERLREGTWVFYRAARDGAGARIVGTIAGLIPADDGTLVADRVRRQRIREERARAAAEYFSQNAERWDRLRSLHVDDAEVERVLLAKTPSRIGDLLDIGTGTGRILEVLGARAQRAEGIDQSHEMLTLARDRLDRTGLGQCSVRHGDLFHLPYEGSGFDVVTLHQVLHYLDEPARAVAEAARMVKSGGRLLIVDFAPHDLENLRDEHAHRRLGFADAEIAGWCRDAGLDPVDVVHLPGRPLTVTVWIAIKQSQQEEKQRG